MARKSRKAPLPASPEITAPSEKIYSAAIYARLSIADTRDGDGGSLDDQIELVKRFLESKDDMRLVEIFSDNGKTGTNFDRAGFEAMMKAIQDGRINCIAVKDLSRFARNYIEAGNYLETIFPFLGIRFISVNDRLDSIEPQYKGEGLGIAVKNLVHDFYSRDLSRKIKAALLIKKQNGDFIGDYAPYGYRKSESNKNKLIIDSEAAAVVRDIFHWRLGGMAIIQIAHRLNEMGTLTPRDYSSSKEYFKAHKRDKLLKWGYGTVRRVLRNTYYTGHTPCYNTNTAAGDFIEQQQTAGSKLFIENTHEAIITDDEFKSVQNQFCESRQGGRSNHKISIIQDWPRQEKLFIGIIFCAECGHKLSSYYYAVKKDRKINRGLYCRYCRETIPGNLRPVFLPQYKVEMVVLESIKQQINTCVEINNVIDGVRASKTLQTQRSALKTEIGSIERSLKQTKNRLATLYANYQDNVLTADEYSYIKTQYNTEIESANAKLDELRLGWTKYEKEAVSENLWVKALNSISEQKTLTREMIQALIERIEITHNGRVIIQFKFRDAYSQLVSLTGQPEAYTNAPG